MWRQLNENLRQSGKTLADEGKSEDEMRAEYHRIAERRVRLGLVVGEIGERNEIKITQDEMRRALIEQARRFPGQEKAVYEYYEKTPGALAELRAPIFEDKVVDFILEKVKSAGQESGQGRAVPEGGYRDQRLSRARSEWIRGGGGLARRGPATHKETPPRFLMRALRPDTTPEEWKPCAIQSGL